MERIKEQLINNNVVKGFEQFQEIETHEDDQCDNIFEFIADYDRGEMHRLMCLLVELKKGAVNGKI